MAISREVICYLLGESTIASQRRGVSGVSEQGDDRMIEIMATVGPTGLTYMVCEMYFDDCTVFVQSSSLLLVPELGPRNSIPRDGEIQKILSVRGTSTNVPSTSSYASQQPPPPPGHPPISTGYSSKPYSGNNQSRRGRGKVLSNLIYHLTSFCYLTFSA